MAVQRAPESKKKRLSVLSIVVASVGTVLAVALLALIGIFTIALMVYRSYADDLAPPEELAINRPSTGAKIFDRNGVLLYEYVDDKEGRRLPVRLEEVNPAFLAATIATEDAGFFANPGVNPRGLMRASWENFGPLIKNEGDVLKGSGGSSITQQLVKNVYISKEDRSKRSLERKLREVIYSIELTKRYTKAQLLEWYVNQISYGGIYTGVEAASQGYFGKSAKDLTLAEATLLAGIPQSPAAFDPVNNLEAALARRNEVIDLMARRQTIQIGEDVSYTPITEELELARNANLDIHQQRFPIEAPHFILTYVAPQLEKILGRDAVLHDGLIVTTTLDLSLQQKVQQIMERWISEFERISNTHNGATMVVVPETGEILVMIGSRDYFNEEIDGNVNNLLAVNSPGSSFKPFVYLTSFVKLGWNPGTMLQDTPVTYRESNGTVFQPQNPSKNSYQGSITLRNSLGNSLNVPAFKTAQALGVDSIVQMARSMGFTSLDGHYGPAIAIGGVDVKPLDLTYGYSVLANGGVMVGHDTLAPGQPTDRQINPIAILKVEDSHGKLRYDVDEHRAKRRIVNEAHAYMVSDILSDARAQCITFGCGGITIPGRQVAVKTGTSEPFDPKGPNAGKIGETWAFGYTPDFTVGVWAGNSDNAPIVNVFSTSISYRAMRDILLAAYDGKPGRPFLRPSNLVSRQVCSPVTPPQPKEGEPPPPPPAPDEPPPMNCREELIVR